VADPVLMPIEPVAPHCASEVVTCTSPLLAV
jgi:hypothetical protein